jgi:hypothetical protein
VAGGKIHATYQGRVAATIPAASDPGSFFKTGTYEQSRKEGDGVAQVVLLAGPRVSHGDTPSTPRTAPRAPTQPRTADAPDCAAQYPPAATY